MNPTITLALVAVISTVQWYFNYRTLDGWNLALRREHGLASVIQALGTDDPDAIRAAFLALDAEMRAQDNYAKNRWWFQRSPRVGNAW